MVRSVPALAFVLLLLPAAAADPASLYFHIDGFQEFPIVTEEPALDDTSWSLGMAAHSTDCADATQSVGLLQDFHTFYGHVTAGPLPDIQGARSGFSQGLVSNVTLLAAPTAWWYLEQAGTVPAAPALVLPRVEVRATLREGSGLSPDSAAYNEGVVIAQGVAGPAILAGDSTVQPTSGEVVYERAGDRHVYGFMVPMTLVSPTIPREGAVMRIDIRIESPCPNQEGGFMPNVLRPFTGPERRPRLEAEVSSPLRVEAQAAEDGSTVGFVVRATSAFGPDDVANVTLEVPGAANPPVRVGREVLSSCQCVEEVWTWQRSVADEAVAANATAVNRQGTSQAVALVPLSDGPAKDASGAAFAALAAVALAALAGRRRQP